MRLKPACTNSTAGMRPRGRSVKAMDCPFTVASPRQSSQSSTRRESGTSSRMRVVPPTTSRPSTLYSQPIQYSPPSTGSTRTFFDPNQVFTLAGIEHRPEDACGGRLDHRREADLRLVEREVGDVHPVPTGEMRREVPALQAPVVVDHLALAGHGELPFDGVGDLHLGPLPVLAEHHRDRGRHAEDRPGEGESLSRGDGPESLRGLLGGRRAEGALAPEPEVAAALRREFDLVGEPRLETRRLGEGGEDLVGRCGELPVVRVRPGHRRDPWECGAIARATSSACPSAGTRPRRSP